MSPADTVTPAAACGLPRNAVTRHVTVKPAAASESRMDSPAGMRAR